MYCNDITGDGRHHAHGADDGFFVSALAHCRCILGNVSLPKGCVVTQHGTYDYTQYIVYFNLAKPQCTLVKYDDISA